MVLMIVLYNSTYGDNKMICPKCKNNVRDDMSLKEFNALKQCCLNAMLDNQEQAKFNDPYAYSKAMSESGLIDDHLPLGFDIY